MNLRNAVLAFISVFSMVANAQIDETWQETAVKRYKINKRGMQLLGSWAAFNIIGGGIAYTQTSGVESYFYQMNAGWNLINLAIAMPNLLKKYKEPESFSKNVDQQHTIEKILLLNIGLDVAYMVGGAYLNQLSVTADQQEMLKGYGNSLILQGGFLFLFDCGLYFVQHQHGKKINGFLEKLCLSNNGLGVKLQF